jgi:hypothetical protein
MAALQMVLLPAKRSRWISRARSTRARMAALLSASSLSDSSLWLMRGTGHHPPTGGHGHISAIGPSVRTKWLAGAERACFTAAGIAGGLHPRLHPLAEQLQLPVLDALDLTRIDFGAPADYSLSREGESLVLKHPAKKRHG